MAVALKRILLCFLLAFLSACATNEFAQSSTVVADVKLKSAHLYIYSFLDIRVNELGPTMLAELDKQLVQELGKRDVAGTVLEYKNSHVGKYYIAPNTGVQIPVQQTIESNLENERDFGADYRLVIFPSNMVLSGAWKIYDVRWELFDARTGKKIWFTTSHGRFLPGMSYDENPQERAKKIVDGVMTELQKSNLL